MRPDLREAAFLRPSEAAELTGLSTQRSARLVDDMLFDECKTQDGGDASRVYIVAERVEFLATRNRSTGQAAEPSPEPTATGELRDGQAA